MRCFRPSSWPLAVSLGVLAGCGARTDAEIPDANFSSEPFGAYAVVSRIDVLELHCAERNLSLTMSAWLLVAPSLPLEPVDGELLGTDGSILAAFDVVGAPVSTVPTTIGAVPGSFVALGRDACELCGTDVTVHVRFDEPRFGASAFTPVRRLGCR